jgi:toxin-antitoxin system PIN domain toxin
MTYLVDVNVWVAAALAGHRHQPAAQAWFEEPDTTAALFCRITQNGLLRILTNPRVMGENTLGYPQAWKLYDTFYQDSRVRLAPEPEGTEERWRAFTRVVKSGPNFWTDAYLAAFAAAGGYTVVSFDHGYKRFPGASVRLLV